PRRGVLPRFGVPCRTANRCAERGRQGVRPRPEPVDRRCGPQDPIRLYGARGRLAGRRPHRGWPHAGRSGGDVSPEADSRRRRVVRPLLDISRADLRRYLAGRGERWIDDESNDDLENPRNRIRHVVLPELDGAANGPTRPAIARAAGLAREDAEWLDELAARRYGELAAATPDGLAIETAALLAEPPPLRRRVLLRALRAAAGGREVGFDHVEAAMAVLAGTAGGADIPGARVELRRGKLVLIEQKPSPK